MSTSDVAEGCLISRLRTQAWRWYTSLQPNQCSYLNAFLLLIVYLLLKPFDWELKKGVIALAIIFWTMAMISDLLSLYKRAAETLLGKLIILGSFAFGANVAIAVSAQVLNHAIGVDPGQFTHTIAFTSVLLAPLLIVFLSVIVLFLGMGLITLFFMFQALPDENSRIMMFPWYRGRQIIRYRGVTCLVQLISLVAVFSFAYQWSQDENAVYKGFVESKTNWFLYNFEMFEKTQCRLEEGKKVAFLGDGQILVGTKEGGEISFAVQKCTPSVGMP
jgi:hypothetical protein